MIGGTLQTPWADVPRKRQRDQSRQHTLIDLLEGASTAMGPSKHWHRPRHYTAQKPLGCSVSLRFLYTLLLIAIVSTWCLLATSGQYAQPTCSGLEDCKEVLLIEQQQLSPLSRQLPSIHAWSPIMAAGNWKGHATQEHWDVSRKTIARACASHIARYRVVNRTVYTDHVHEHPDILYHHRDAFLEMLLTAIWLYKKFPDVELWVSHADEPSKCSLNMPILQYSILSPNTTASAAEGDVGHLNGVPFSIPHLLTGDASQPHQRVPSVQFTRGYAIPHGQVWDALGYLPAELRLRQLKQINASVTKHPQLKAQAIWRGSNTGALRGWPPADPTTLLPYSDSWASLLYNKRIQLTRLANPYSSVLDVGLHEITDSLLPPSIAKDKQLLDAFKGLLVKPWASFEDWSSYAVQLSIDGHGVPFRLPKQYFQGRSVVFRMQSPLQDWSEHRFKEGVHYLTFKYNLEDFVSKVLEVMDVYRREPWWLQTMASAAALQAVEVFNFYAQLDALAYAALKVKSACPWPLTVPQVTMNITNTTKEFWTLPKLQRGKAPDRWRSPVWKSSWAVTMRANMVEQLHHNFPAVGDL